MAPLIFRGNLITFSNRQLPMIIKNNEILNFYQIKSLSSLFTAIDLFPAFRSMPKNIYPKTKHLANEAFNRPERPVRVYRMPRTP